MSRVLQSAVESEIWEGRQVLVPVLKTSPPFSRSYCFCEKISFFWKFTRILCNAKQLKVPCVFYFFGFSV